MQINLFTCTAEFNRVNKTAYISNRFTLEGSLRNESSVIDPVIVVEKTNPAMYHYNYMYIEEFQRWYFINDIIALRTNLWEIHAHVDVLHTWGSDIGNMEATIDKAESEGLANLYYDDGSFIMDCRNNVYVKEFPSGFNENGQYILICAGGT